MRFITRLSLPRILAVLLAAACWMQSANAGTKGSMINTFGRGVSVNTVVYNGGTNTARSPLTQNPSSAVYDFNYGLEGVDPYDTSVTQTGLPIGTPKEIYSRSLGTAPGVWTWDAFVMDGATADNPALTAKLPIVPAGLASYNVRFTNFVDGANKIGGVRLEGFATKGAGVWLRVIEFTGVGEPTDIDDLIAHGDLKLEVTLAGPFFFDQTNCTDVKIPFTFKRTTNEVYFVADGVALSIPFIVSSPDLPGQCGVPVIYPSATVSGGSGTNTVSYSPPSGTTFGYGVHTVTVIAEDTYLGRTNRAGARFPLRTTNSFKVTVTDTIPPMMTCPAPIVQSTDLGFCSAIVAVVVPVATDNCGAAVGGIRSDNLPLNAAYPKGVTTIAWTATDAAGNSTNCTQTITVIDTEKPVISGMPANISLTSSAGNPLTCAQVATWTAPTASDNCGVTSFTSTHTSGASFPVGSTTVTYTAVDAANNTNTASFTVTVKDDTKPIINCPANIVASTRPSGCDATVSVTPATATDNCGVISITGVRSDTLALNLPYPKGVTTITWIATDAAQNSSTCTQKVTVNDTVPPIAKAKPLQIILDASGNASITASQINDGSTDNCGGIKSITLSKTSFNCGNLGPNPVRLTVTDTSDNVSFADTTITVLDCIAPVKPTLPTITGTCLSPVVLTAPTTTDICSGVVTGTTTGPTTFTTAGNYTVTWKFTDSSGNSVTANQTVVVPSLTFDGFYINSLISCLGGTCSTPVRTQVCGGTIPIKFRVKCDTSFITTGSPTVVIEKSNSSCTSLTPSGTGSFTRSGNDWVFNWNTSGLARATYKLTTTLQDGSKKVVWIKLNRTGNDGDD